MSNRNDRRSVRSACRRAAVILGIFALFAAPAAAVTVVIEPDRDNSMYENNTSNSNGIGPELFGGLAGVGERRALLRFDVAGNVPSGATINSVELRMTVTRSGPTASNGDVFTLNRLTADWGEAASGAGTNNNGNGSAAAIGDATWTFRNWNTVAWTTPGGDFVAGASASTAVPATSAPYPPTGFSFASTAQLVADVTDMLANPGGNHGWILLGGTSAGGARKFDSREAAVASQRPQLVVDYTLSTQIVTLEPVRDNSLYEQSGAISNGAGPELFSGRTDGFVPFGLRRALMLFDVAGSIPPGSTIVDVSLAMNVEQAGPMSNANQLSSLHRVAADWGEGNSGAGSVGNGAGSTAQVGADATWTDRFHTVSTWATPGGDFVPGASATFATPTFGAVTIPSNAAMVADVTAWLSNPSANFGWILRGDEAPGASRTARRWSSRESANASARPQLTIQYIAGSGGGTRGTVPDGDDLPGTPLTVDKAAGTDVQLDWDTSCKADDTDYGVYEGTIGTWYSHAAVACSTAGALSYTYAVPLTPGTGAYFLVVPNDTSEEGSYGDDSANAERPAAGSFCFTQSIGAPVCP